LNHSGVATSSISFGWDNGGNVTFVGWQVTLSEKNIGATLYVTIVTCHHHILKVVLTVTTTS